MSPWTILGWLLVIVVGTPIVFPILVALLAGIISLALWPAEKYRKWKARKNWEKRNPGKTYPYRWSNL